ncbi:MAG: anti-sigma factor [Gammaproteobacteria bacterium]|nr:anti-sigma factor [Gammaproteobacteria bacterium]
MKNSIHSISMDEIHAYVDGQLTPQRRAFVEEQMAKDPELKATIEHYQTQNDMLHQAFDGVLEEPVPAKLLLKTHPVARRPLWFNIAASIGLLFTGGTLGWTINGAQLAHYDAVEGLAKPAAFAHAVYSPEVKHPVEVGADQEQHLIAWLSKRLGNEIAAPNLAQLGFSLVGGRLLPSDNGPAAQFMYQDESGSRMTLYVRNKHNDEQNTAFRFHQQDNTNSFYWIDGNLGYVLSGDFQRQQMLNVANNVYQQLSF